MFLWLQRKELEVPQVSSLLIDIPLTVTQRGWNLHREKVIFNTIDNWQHHGMSNGESYAMKVFLLSSEHFSSICSDAHQRQAAELMSREPLVVVSGRGGCGKTHVVSKVFQEMEDAFIGRANKM